MLTYASRAAVAAYAASCIGSSLETEILPGLKRMQSVSESNLPGAHFEAFLNILRGVSKRLHSISCDTLGHSKREPQTSLPDLLK